MGELFKPLESCIREKFIPAPVGRPVSDIEGRMLALPPRLGGIDIRDPSRTAEHEFSASLAITAGLSTKIMLQSQDTSDLSHEESREVKRTLLHTRDGALNREFDDICEQLTEEARRYFLSATERGSSAWLSALPLKILGYVLNKREFRDALRLRYGWDFPELPRNCVCGELNTVSHTLDCKHGGFVSLRHNELRDTEAHILKEVAYDVRVEPELQDLSENIQLSSGSNLANNTRLDISARGVFSRSEVTFFDVRVTNPNFTSSRDLSLSAVYQKHERQKVTAYNDRILQVEKGAFVPLVYTTSGGMSAQCQALHKRVGELIADRTNEKFADVIRYIRTRLRFSVLRSTLAALRGFRGKAKTAAHNIDELSFNLIPRVDCYDGF